MSGEQHFSRILNTSLKKTNHKTLLIVKNASPRNTPLTTPFTPSLPLPPLSLFTLSTPLLSLFTPSHPPFLPSHACMCAGEHTACGGHQGACEATPHARLALKLGLGLGLVSGDKGYGKETRARSRARAKTRKGRQGLRNNRQLQDKGYDQQGSGVCDVVLLGVRARVSEGHCRGRLSCKHVSMEEEGPLEGMSCRCSCMNSGVVVVVVVVVVVLWWWWWWWWCICAKTSC